MARNKGLAPFSANFEPQIAAPLDARYVVDTVADLISSTIWTAHDSGIYTYKGMIVAVINDSTPENNGLYYLADDDYTNAGNWIKVGTGGASQPGILMWQSSTGYTAGDHIIAPNDNLYRAVDTHISSSSFDTDLLNAHWTREALPLSTWVSTRAYNTRDLVFQSGVVYVSQSDHVAGTDFLDDLLLGYWKPVTTTTVFTSTGDVLPENILVIETSTGRVAKTLTSFEIIDTFDAHITAGDLEIFVPEEFHNLTPTEIAVGGVPIGTTFNHQTIPQVLDMLFYPELFPTLTPPSSTFTMSITGLREIGETIASITFNATFDRGSIDPAYGTSGYRSGLPNAYVYTGTGLPASVPKTDLSDSQSITDYVVTSGVQTWSGAVSYDEGEQPLSNKGNPYDSPLPAGTTSYISRTITGVYPYFGTTVAIDTMTKQTLAVHNATYWQLNMVGESGGNKQRGWFPQAFSTITGIQFYNTVSGQWEWIGGSKAASLLTFTVTSVQLDINGTMVDYNLYTHNGSTIGARQLRFYTT